MQHASTNRMCSCTLQKEGMEIERNDRQSLLYNNEDPSELLRNLEIQLCLLCNTILLTVSYILRPLWGCLYKHAWEVEDVNLTYVF
jgi:hypothetical protein